MSIQKKPEIDWELFRNDLKSRLPGISINEKYSYQNSWCEVNLNTFDDFNNFAMPLLRESWKFISK